MILVATGLGSLVLGTAVGALAALGATGFFARSLERSLETIGIKVNAKLKTIQNQPKICRKAAF